MLADNGDTYMVHFTPQHTAANKIPDEDMTLILGSRYSNQDVYINGSRVEQKTSHARMATCTWFPTYSRPTHR